MSGFGPIENGVPLPPTAGPLRLALWALEVGESRLVEGYTRNNIRMAAWRNGITVRVHADGAGLRVWRTS